MGCPAARNRGGERDSVNMDSPGPATRTTSRALPRVAGARGAPTLPHAHTTALLTVNAQIVIGTMLAMTCNDGAGGGTSSDRSRIARPGFGQI